MSDMIDRQAAIDALHMHLMYRMGTDSNKKRLDDWINSLPSAQPEIIRCKDCEHWKNGHLCEKLSRFGSFETKADFYCGYPERRTDD